MTRKECLDEAAKCVLKDRQNQYGGPENNFERIAQMWNGYLGTNSIKPWDVAAMMGMLKMARARFNPKYADNWVDMAGYAACGIECATAQEEFDKALDEFQRQSLKHIPPKAEAEGCEEPEFKPGDRVQYHVTLPSVSDGMWVDAEYDGKLTNGREHTVKTEKLGIVVVDGKDIRPAPKAEGCEELVRKDLHEDCEGCVYRLEADAPQTKEELYSKILESNPATYGRAHKPTGEELAELAEEDAHG